MAERTNHVLKQRRVVGRRAPCAFPGTMLRGERCTERIAKFRQEQSEVAKEGVTAVNDPAQDGGMPFDGQSVNDEARAAPKPWLNIRRPV